MAEALTQKQIDALFESDTLLDRGKALRARKKYFEAESLIKQALDKRKIAVGPEDESYAQFLYELAELYEMQGSYDDAIDIYGQAATILEKAFYAGHTRVGFALERQGVCLLAKDKLQEAEAVLKRALEIFDKTLTGEHRSTLITIHRLGELYRKLGKFADAETVLNKGLKQVDTPLGPAEEFRYDLAVIYAQQNKNAEAETAYKAALEGFEQRKNYWRLADCLESYAGFLRQSGRQEELNQLNEQLTKVKEVAKFYHRSDLFTATLLRA